MFAVAIVLATAFSAFAQKGAIGLSPAVELGVPVGNSEYSTANFGIGLAVKGLYGIADNSQITLTTGLGIYSSRDRFISTFIPILAGYRHCFNKFYIEPQLGYGFNTIAKAAIGSSGSAARVVSGFTWAAGMGYAFEHIDIGARYQSALKASEAFDGSSFNTVVFKIGYTFGLNKSK